VRNVTAPCGFSSCVSTTVNVNSPPTATITPATSTSLCSGQTVVLNANTGSGLTYQWQFNGGNISGATNSSYTASSAGTYTVIVTSNGCPTTSSGTLVTVTAPPTTATVSSATLSVCGSLTSGSLGGNTPSAGTGTWSIVSGGTGNFSAINSGSSTFTANAYGTYVLRWTVSNSPCADASATVTVTFTPPIGFGNVQSPASGTINACQTFNVFGQVWIDGFTNPAGATTGLVAELGWSTSNSNPSTWTNWQAATFNSQAGNNDEFLSTLNGSTLGTGTYYYAYRYSYNGCTFYYGGTSGAWNNNNGVLTVTSCENFGSFGSAVYVQTCSNNVNSNTFYRTEGDISPNNFNNNNFGSYFQNSGALKLQGGEVKTWRNAGANVCEPILYYRVYPTGVPSGAFNPVTLPIYENCPGGAFPNGGPCTGNDQKWQRPGLAGVGSLANIDLTTLSPGTYQIEVYFDVPGNHTGANGCPNTVYISNNGANYKASFTIVDQVAASNTGPYCVGQTIQLNGSSATSPSWTGPVSFSNTTQNPTRPTATETMSGEYIFTSTLSSGCSQSASTFVTVSTSALANNNGPVCVGDALSLTSSTGSSYTWSGPNSFSSSVQNPSVSASATTAMAGVYTVSIVGACGSIGGVVDNFSDGNFTANPVWTSAAGGWQIYSSGSVQYLRGDNNATVDRIYTPSTQAYGTWNFDYQFQTTSGTSNQIVRFFVTANNNTTTASGYYVFIDGSGVFQLRRLDAGTPATLINATWNPNLQWRTVKVVRNFNNIFELYLDGVLKGTSAADATYTTSSLIGVWNTGNSATDNHYIDNISCSPPSTAQTTVVVNNPVTPTFTQVAPICSGATLAALPTTSNNSITGIWSPALNNTTTTLYTFTPNSGQCGTTAEMTITVNNPVMPTFTQVTDICPGGSLSALPTTSNNSITGTWSPALDNTQTTTYTFTPTSGLCANTAQMTITVLPPFTTGTVQGISGSGGGPGHLVIYQVYGAGGNSGATYTNDFVVLYNPTGSAVNLSGWSLQYVNTNGNFTSGASNQLNLTGIIQSGGYFLVQLAAGGTPSGSLPTPDQTGSIAMGGSNGKLLLVNSTTTLSGACPSSTTIIDKVGYGTGECFEGTAAISALSATTWATRKNNGCTDENINSTDFIVGNTVAPRNSASPLNFCTTISNTQTICAGQSASTITATAASGANGTFTYQWYSQAGNVPCPTGSSTAGWTPIAGETNLTYSPGTVSATTTYALFVTVTGANNCGGAWANDCRKVVVNPTPIVSDISTNTCSGTAFSVTPANGTNGTVPPTTTYSWAAPSVSGITGTAAGTNTSSISGTLTNTTNAPINVIYTVTPVAGSCTGTTFTVTVTVNPRPTLSNAIISACTGVAFSHIPTGSNLPSGTTYSWSIPSGTNFTGGASGSGESTVDGTLTLSSGSSATAVYTVTPISGTCSGNTFTVTVGLSSCAPPLPFTACNLVVYEIGDGSVLDNNAFPISIKEITPNGANVQTISNAFIGANLLTQNGLAASVGLLNSYNGLLSVPGYSVTSGNALNTIAPASSDLINKVNSILDGNGLVQSYTLLPTAAPIPFSGNHLRSTLPLSANTFYATGAGGNDGLYFYDGTTFSQLVSVNARGLEIFNNQLYISTVNNVFQVGTGLQTSGTLTTTALLPTYTNPGIYGFSISPDGCTMYVADNGSNNNYRGVSKYKLVGGTWTYQYNYQTWGIALVVDYSGTNDIVYVTTAINGNNAPNKIEKLIDNPTGNNFTVVTTGGWPVTPATNNRFAGIDFTPNSTASISIPDVAAQSFNVCQNGTAQTLSATGTSSSSLTYQWYSNTTNDFCGATAIPSATSASYTPPTSSVTTMYYFLIVKGACSNYLRSTMATVVVNPNPTPTISGNVPLCIGGNITLTANPAGQNYLWSPGGQTTQAITVTSSGNYSVTVTDSNNCSAQSNATNVINATSPSVIFLSPP